MSVVEPAGTAEVDVVAWNDETADLRPDALAVEEPLEIRLAGYSVAVTMRTPGDDVDLVVGFLFTEGIVRSADDVGSIAHCPTDDVGSLGNIINVNPSDPAIVDPDRWRRNFVAGSSCGICGKASIEAVRRDHPGIRSKAYVSRRILYRMAGDLQRSQAVFGRTGGLHAAALFDTSGRLLAAREDVGRHNAVDKVIGHMVRRRAEPLGDSVLMVSGRASFEIVQKALAAGVPIVAAVSAPSSLAVDLARDAGMTLVGFLRASGGQGRFNVYTGEERVG